jgi:hypothetical protein
MITVVMTVDTHAEFGNGEEGIALSLNFTHTTDDRPHMVELASEVINRFAEAMKQGAAQSKEGLHYVETIHPKDQDDVATPDLPPDLLAALEVAKHQFTGIEQLVQHSPRDIAEIHIATVLRDYLKQTAEPMGTYALEVLAELGNATAKYKHGDYRVRRESYERAIDLLHRIYDIGNLTHPQAKKETGE